MARSKTFRKKRKYKHSNKHSINIVIIREHLRELIRKHLRKLIRKDVQ